MKERQKSLQKLESRKRKTQDAKKNGRSVPKIQIAESKTHALSRQNERNEQRSGSQLQTSGRFRENSDISLYDQKVPQITEIQARKISNSQTQTYTPYEPNQPLKKRPLQQSEFQIEKLPSKNTTQGEKLVTSQPKFTTKLQRVPGTEAVRSQEDLVQKTVVHSFHTRHLSEPPEHTQYKRSSAEANNCFTDQEQMSRTMPKLHQSNFRMRSPVPPTAMTKQLQVSFRDTDEQLMQDRSSKQESKRKTKQSTESNMTWYPHYHTHSNKAKLMHVIGLQAIEDRVNKQKTAQWIAPDHETKRQYFDGPNYSSQVNWHHPAHEKEVSRVASPVNQHEQNVDGHNQSRFMADKPATAAAPKQQKALLHQVLWNDYSRDKEAIDGNRTHTGTMYRKIPVSQGGTKGNTRKKLVNLNRSTFDKFVNFQSNDNPRENQTATRFDTNHGFNDMAQNQQRMSSTSDHTNSVHRYAVERQKAQTSLDSDYYQGSRQQVFNSQKRRHSQNPTPADETGSNFRTTQSTVFRGCFELSKHDHATFQKLTNKINGKTMAQSEKQLGDLMNNTHGHSVNSSIHNGIPFQSLDQTSVLASIKDDEENVYKDRRNIARNTLKMKQFSNKQRNQTADLFFNPKFFDKRFGSQGMEKDESVEKKPKIVIQKSVHSRQSKPSSLPRKLPKPKQSIYEPEQPMDFVAKKHNSIEGESEKFTLAPRPDFNRAREPPTTSQTFDDMMGKFIDPEVRDQYKAMELRKETEKHYHLHHVKEDQRLVRSVGKRKRVLDKLAFEQKRQNNRPKEWELQSEEKSSYRSSQSSESKTNSNSTQQSEKLEQLFEMNEIQITTMLAKTVATHGEILPNEVEDELELMKKPVEMTSLQRQKGLLMVQMFFADLGDPTALSMKEQEIMEKQLAANKRYEDQLEKVRLKEEREAKKKKREERRQKIAAGIEVSELSKESEHTAEEEETTEQEEEGSDQDSVEKANAVKVENKQIDYGFNTNTHVSTDSPLKRQKLDDAVRKIMLFGDMHKSQIKGEIEGHKTTANQDFIKETIQNFSGQITAPAKIIERSLRLKAYFLNVGVCKSLGKYFSNLTFNHLQELWLEENGLKDQHASYLIQGLTELKELKKITYALNELGPLIAEQISTMLLWSAPYCLEELTLSKVKTTNYSMAIVLSALKLNRKLIKFQLHSISIQNPKLYDYVYSFVKNNKVIQNLALTWAYILPSQVNQIMRQVIKKKDLYFLDLSWNNMVDNTAQERQVKTNVQIFIGYMRRFLMRSSIFHLNLTGMQLGENVHKLTEAVKASTTLACIHLSANSIPIQIVAYYDSKLQTPQMHPIKITSFRPKKTAREGRQTTRQTDDGNKTKEDFDNNEVQKLPASPDDQSETASKPDILVENLNANGQNLTDKDNNINVSSLRNELSLAIKGLVKDHTGIPEKTQLVDHHQGRVVKQKDFFIPLSQDPLIYQRFLNHPEFAFPNMFMAPRQKPRRATMLERMNIEQLVKRQIAQEDKDKVEGTQRTNRISQDDLRHDSAYYTQDTANKWSKISVALTQKDRPGHNQQPAWNAIGGREGIVSTNHETCWVCENRKYVVLSWDRDNINKQWGEPITSLKDINRIKKKYLADGQMPGLLGDTPIMISSLNDWFPIHMMNVVPFSMLFDYQLATELAHNNINEDSKDNVQKFKAGYQQLIDHISNTQELEASYFPMYKKQWRSCILKNLIYPHDSFFIDFPQDEERNINSNNLFMYAAFVKPGKHRVIIYDPVSGENDHGSWYIRDFYVDERHEDLPKFVQFHEEEKAKEQILNSIMKEWKTDSEQLLEQCFNHDEALWKVQKYIRDPIDYDTFLGLIKEHMFVLKEIFLHSASKDSFPHMGQFATEVLCENIGILDNKQIKRADVDRLFITANYEVEQHDDNPSNLLCRYEFIEFISRLANLKFKETGQAQTYSQALQKIMKDYILPYHSKHTNDWHVFRQKYLTKTIIDHTLHANRKGFEKIFMMYVNQNKKKIFNETNAEQYNHDMQLNLLEGPIRYCFGMSKQTIYDEMNKSDGYSRLTFIEFLEFTARLLHTRLLIEQGSDGDQKKGSDHQKSDAKLPTDEQQKEELQRDLLVFKEFMCRTLDTFFESKGVEFFDPDEEPEAGDSSELSEFQYNLPDGYDHERDHNISTAYLDEDKHEQEYLNIPGLADEMGIRSAHGSPKHNLNIAFATDAAVRRNVETQRTAQALANN